MVSALDLSGDDAFSLSSPLAGITGVLQLQSALSKHAAVVFEERFSAATALARIREHGVTLIGGAPSSSPKRSSTRPRASTWRCRCAASPSADR
jgi:hypothetical protein